MKKPRVGVVGLGYMGARFARLILESPRADLAAVADLDPSLVDRAEADWGARGYPDVESMIAGESTLDALVIATPDQAHVQPSLAGARAGMDLFVEKPLATSSEECRAVIDSAAKAGSNLLVGHTLRFDPRYAAARAAIRGGRIGEVVHTYSCRNNTARVLRRQGDSSSLAIYLGVHDIDFLLWSFDARVVRVTARGRRGVLTQRGLDLDDTIFSLIEFDNGVLSCIENSWWVAGGGARAHLLSPV